MDAYDVSDMQYPLEADAQTSSPSSDHPATE